MNDRILAIETIVWIYWFFCAIAMFLVISNKKFVNASIGANVSSPRFDRNYKISLIFGWIATIIAATCYILFTRKYEAGYYSLLDSFLFSFLNGILSQYLSIFWFLIGCFISRFFAINNSQLVFTSGYISYALFSGAIRAFFWTKVLPHHEPNGIIMFLTISIMSLAWMWLFWRYRAVIPIIAMHFVMDFLTIGYLHFAPLS